MSDEKKKKKKKKQTAPWKQEKFVFIFHNFNGLFEYRLFC